MMEEFMPFFPLYAYDRQIIIFTRKKPYSKNEIHYDKSLHWLEDGKL
jgi:hypothetical protein